MYARYSPAGGMVTSSYDKVISTAELSNFPPEGVSTLK